MGQGRGNRESRGKSLKPILDYLPVVEKGGEKRFFCCDMLFEAETSRQRGDKTSPHNPPPGTKINMLCLSSLPCATLSSKEEEDEEASASSK